MKSNRSIDKTDACILRYLLKDARTSFVEIAKNCGVHSNVVRTHFNRLKQDGIITGEITEINPQAFGYNFFSLAGLRVESDQIKSVIKKLEKMFMIIQSDVGVGGINLLCFVAARDISQLNDTIEQLRAIEGVTAVDSDLVVLTNRGIFPENLQIAEEE